MIGYNGVPVQPWPCIGSDCSWHKEKSQFWLDQVHYLCGLWTNKMATKKNRHTLKSSEHAIFRIWNLFKNMSHNASSSSFCLCSKDSIVLICGTSYLDISPTGAGFSSGNFSFLQRQEIGALSLSLPLFVAKFFFVKVEMSECLGTSLMHDCVTVQWKHYWREVMNLFPMQLISSYLNIYCRGTNAVNSRCM
jgi:hypothetical protein